MNPFIKQMLIFHVLTGVAGVFFLFLLLLEIAKKRPSLLTLKRESFYSFLGIIFSFVTGAYYYLVYYGSSVKPIIKKSAYPFAHTVFMETKEHLFLFLPFLTFIIVYMVYSYGNQLEKEEKLKKAIFVLISVAFGIGMLISFMGMLVGGAVTARPI